MALDTNRLQGLVILGVGVALVDKLIKSSDNLFGGKKSKFLWGK